MNLRLVPFLAALIGAVLSASGVSQAANNTWQLPTRCVCDSQPRNQVLGDWFGRRTCMAEKGITADLDATMFYMGVASGGLEQEFRFSGHNDYVVNMDLGKLGLQKGMFVKLRGENRYGESLAGATGTFVPAIVAADLPVPDSTNVYLSNVLFTQMVSERVGFFFGKLDTLDGDTNAFARGRGKTQFSNLAFVASPIVLRTVPYSTLGAGMVVLGEDAEPMFSFNVLNPTDVTGTSGLDELFAEGVSLNSELRLPTNFLDRPGHQLIGGSWSSREYVALTQDPRIILPNVPIARRDGSWSLYWNFDQYLYVDPCDESRGWGLFGRAGIADAATNPISWFLSFGIGGYSRLPGRSNDQFGVGWYYSGTSEQLAPTLATAIGGVGDGQGVEIFYDIEVTPWLHITPDFQVLMPPRNSVDTAIVAGLRSRIIF